MGKGLAFLQLKGWHPGNKNNIEKKWKYQQKEKLKKQKQEERRLQRIHETEVLKNKRQIVQMGGHSAEKYRTELKRADVNWMYELPPGLKEMEETEKAKTETKDREKEFQTSIEGLSRDERRKAEILFEETLTARERQLRRFEFLRNAPLEAAHVDKATVNLNHKPFGKVIKNVKCFTCGQWGHRFGDIECPLSKRNPIGPARLELYNKDVTIHEKKKQEELEFGRVRNTVVKEDEEDNLILKLDDGAYGGYSRDHFTQQLVSDGDSSSDEDDIKKIKTKKEQDILALAKQMSSSELEEFLKTFGEKKSKKKKKKSKKKKKKSKKKKKKKKKRKRSSSSSSDSEEERRKSKKKRKLRHDSDSDEEDSSTSSGGVPNVFKATFKKEKLKVKTEPQSSSDDDSSKSKKKKKKKKRRTYRV